VDNDPNGFIVAKSWVFADWACQQAAWPVFTPAEGEQLADILRSSRYVSHAADDVDRLNVHVLAR